MATRYSATGFLSCGSGAACAGDDGAREPDLERPDYTYTILSLIHSLVWNWLISAVLPTPGAPTMATRYSATGFLSWGSGAACAGDEGAREPERGGGIAVLSLIHSLVWNWLISAVLPTPGAPTMATRYSATGFLSWGSGAACAGDEGAREPERERRRRNNRTDCIN
ncbi:hypothetical protein JYU34_020930 [Plutella xylostella]|uniref:Uncharacterized protein n=1 Tax=Plutella xylostella TaxID=51655 RepID=A0ABQ7PST5_PLUXY|nr:hypothetical protein JYU34_020930 [Plutella xylostella]